MKKIVTFLISSMLLIAAAVPVYADEPIVHLDFESDFQSNGWNFDREISTDCAVSGERSLKLTAKGDWAEVDFNASALNGSNFKNNYYRMSFYARGESGGELCFATAYYADGNQSKIYDRINVTEEFKKYECVFKIDSKTDIWDTRIMIMSEKPTVGQVFYIDDLTFELIPKIKLSGDECVPKANDMAAIASDEIKLAFTTELGDVSVDNFMINGSAELIESVEKDGRFVTLKLAGTLEEDVTYTVSINRITDFLGRRMQAGTLIFRTLDVTAPPRITVVSPADNSAQVSVNPVITVGFSVETQGLEGHIKINGEDVKSIETEDNKVFRITPNTLNYGTMYKIEISGVLSTYGAEMTETYTSGFFTEQQGSIIYSNDFETGDMSGIGGWETERTITADYAASGEKSIKVESKVANRTIEFNAALKVGTLYKLSFDGAIDPSNVNNKAIASAYVYWDGNLGQSVQKLISRAAPPAADGSFGHFEQYFVIPEDAAAADTRFYFFGDNAMGAGIFYLDNVVLEKMPSLEVLPVSYPKDGDTVGAADEISIMFNAPMNLPKSVTLNGEDATGVSLDGGYTLKIKPDGGLKNNKDYTLKISGIKDTYGRSADDYSVSFKTEPSYVVSGFKAEKSGGKITASADSIENLKASGGEAVLKLMLYKNGIMIDEKEQKVKMAAGTSAKNLEVSVDIPQGGCSVIAAIWENNDNIMPLCKSIYISEGE